MGFPTNSSITESNSPEPAGLAITRSTPTAIAGYRVYCVDCREPGEEYTYQIGPLLADPPIEFDTIHSGHAIIDQCQPVISLPNQG
ncbi:MAG: hypothetical protein ABSG53_04925 [Thermoguttaceae bacterium]